MGLFLGCSLITAMELFIAVLYLLLYLVKRLASCLLPNRSPPVQPRYPHRITISVTSIHPR